jgi:hypothetical protein
MQTKWTGPPIRADGSLARQLIIITAVVGVVFGIGRFLVTNLAGHVNLGRGEAPIFIFLTAAAIVLTLPLLLAGLMVLLALVLVGIATAFELPLFTGIQSGPRPDTLIFVAINSFSAVVVLTVVVVTRLSGYSLIAHGSNLSESQG